MASEDETVVVSAPKEVAEEKSSPAPATEARADREVDSEAKTSKPVEEHAAGEGKNEKKEGIENLKSVVVISGVVVAVVGALFAIVKKMRQA